MANYRHCPNIGWVSFPPGPLAPDRRRLGDEDDEPGRPVGAEGLAEATVVRPEPGAGPGDQVVVPRVAAQAPRVQAHAGVGRATWDKRPIAKEWARTLLVGLPFCCVSSSSHLT